MALPLAIFKSRGGLLRSLGGSGLAKALAVGGGLRLLLGAIGGFSGAAKVDDLRHARSGFAAKSVDGNNLAIVLAVRGALLRGFGGIGILGMGAAFGNIGGKALGGA